MTPSLKALHIIYRFTQNGQDLDSRCLNHSRVLRMKK